MHPYTLEYITANFVAMAGGALGGEEGVPARVAEEQNNAAAAAASAATSAGGGEVAGAAAASPAGEADANNAAEVRQCRLTSG